MGLSIVFCFDTGILCFIDVVIASIHCCIDLSSVCCVMCGSVLMLFVLYIVFLCSSSQFAFLVKYVGDVGIRKGCDVMFMSIGKWSDGVVGPCVIFIL